VRGGAFSAGRLREGRLADVAAGSGPRESAAAASSQQSQLRSEDSEPGRLRRSVRRGTGEEEEEVGVGGAAPQITSENLAAIWLPHWPPGCAAAVPFAQT